MNQFEVFVSCPSGLETLLADELAELGFSDVKIGFRGVHLQADMEGVYRINYQSRIAGRVLVPIRSLRCRDSKAFYREMREIDWVSYFPEGKTFAIDVHGQHPAFKNTLFAIQVAKDAICDQLREVKGTRPNVNVAAPDIQLNLFLMKEAVLVSFDTSGQPLFKRGYRRETVLAPLQENLAAAILRMAHYNKEEVLLDPCCGSGTFLIEAACLATKTPAGFYRTSWGFQHHPLFDAAAWQGVKQQADEAREPLMPHRITGVDISKDAVRIAKANIRAAGFHKEIEVIQADFSCLTPAVAPTLVVCNPPHGRRMGEESELIPLYRHLGDFFKKQCRIPSKAFVFTGSLELSKQVGLKPAKRHVLTSGGIESRLLEYEIY